MRSFPLSLALSLLAVAAVQAVSPARDVPAFARLSTLSAPTTLLNLRGGGLFGGQKSAARIYKESLEEQVLLLNEQLGHARTEVANLRENAKKRHAAGSSLHRVKPVKMTMEDIAADKTQSKQEEKLEKERQKVQKEQLARLQKEISQLEKMKVELDKLLETSGEKIKVLEEQLSTQESLTAKMEASYQGKIAKLEQQLADIQMAQLNKLTEINQQKIDAAVQDALRAQETEFRAKMEETTRRLSKKHAKEMEQEKLRSSKAVEAERKKMRKLVRALAMREKKLKLASPQKEELPKTSIKTKTSSQPKQFVPPTSRGTI